VLAGLDPAGAPVTPQPAAIVPDEVIAAAARALHSDGDSVLFLGGRTLDERGQRAAVRIGQATGAKLFAETFPRVQRRGAGLPVVERLTYLAEFAQMQIGDATSMVLVDAPRPPRSSPTRASPARWCPRGARCPRWRPAPTTRSPRSRPWPTRSAHPQDVPLAEASRPELPTGPLTVETVAASVGALMPENAIIVDEAQTSGIFNQGATAGAPAHDWLTLTGGAIGIGVPLALGAAIAAPDRAVINLQADGSAMYTLQGWWSQAREGANVTTVIYNNAAYAILRMELARVGAEEAGPKALSMLDLHGPDLDFVQLAQGMGVTAERAETAEQFTEALERALANDGPNVIEAIVPPLGM
jgi:acetolactate synthase-1/2/3 large subunit